MVKNIKTQTWLLVIIIITILITDSVFDYFTLRKNKDILAKSIEINFAMNHLLELNYITVQINNEQKEYLDYSSDTIKAKILLLKESEFELIDKINSIAIQNGILNSDIIPLLQILNNNKMRFNSAKNLKEWIISNSNEISVLNNAIREIEKLLNNTQLKLTEETEINSSRMSYEDVLLTILIILITIRLIHILNDNKKQKEMVAELKTLNTTKDKLFSIISHDLKTPFTAILGFADLLHENVEHYPIKKTKQFILNITDASQRAYNLLENLLEWSLLQTGKINPNIQPVLINETIENVVGLLKSYANQKKIILENDVTLSLMVLADKNILSIILHNLISNALKFTKTNGKVSVKAYTDPENISIYVVDNGIGIEKGKIENLFKIEVNNSTVGTNGEKGTGLGLVLCKELIEMNKGQIEVESEPGQGTTFTIHLPKA